MNNIAEEILTPGYHGEECRHNGENTDYEIACDNCSFFYSCFPDADLLFQNPELYEDKNLYHLKTASNEVLQAFLRANTVGNEIDEKIKMSVMEELARRYGVQY